MNSLRHVGMNAAERGSAEAAAGGGERCERVARHKGEKVCVQIQGEIRNTFHAELERGAQLFWICWWFLFAFHLFKILHQFFIRAHTETPTHTLYTKLTLESTRRPGNAFAIASGNFSLFHFTWRAIHNAEDSAETRREMERNGTERSDGMSKICVIMRMCLQPGK